jgi:AraC family transcriptional regulator
MQPRFETIDAKVIAGLKLNMSFSDNKTGALWQSFMSRRAEIENPVNSLLYSLEVYPSGFFEDFKPTNEFEKWAGVEVKDNTDQPDGIELLTIPAGQYAVFTHRGPASFGPKTYQYIFGVWLPASDYIIDDRPHFALMDEKYKHEQPDSEEDIYIPVKPR